jgi:hypothetical protein
MYNLKSPANHSCIVCGQSQAIIPVPLSNSNVEQRYMHEYCVDAYAKQCLGVTNHESRPS